MNYKLREENEEINRFLCLFNEFCPQCGAELSPIWYYEAVSESDSIPEMKRKIRQCHFRDSPRCKSEN